MNRVAVISLAWATLLDKSKTYKEVVELNLDQSSFVVLKDIAEIDFFRSFL